MDENKVRAPKAASSTREFPYSGILNNSVVACTSSMWLLSFKFKGAASQEVLEVLKCLFLSVPVSFRVPWRDAGCERSSLLAENDGTGESRCQSLGVPQDDLLKWLKCCLLCSFCLLFDSKLIPAAASPKTGTAVRRAKSNAAMHDFYCGQ